MKRLLPFLVIPVLLLVSACSKTSSPGLHSNLIGGWQFLYAKGGFSGHDSIPADPANQKSIWFHSDSTYALKNNNQEIGSGTFKIREEVTIFSTQPLPVIVLSINNESVSMIFDIHSNALWLTDTHYEPYTAVYRWIQQSAGEIK